MAGQIHDPEIAPERDGPGLVLMGVSLLVGLVVAVPFLIVKGLVKCWHSLRGEAE